MKTPIKFLTSILFVFFAYNAAIAQVKSAYNQTIDFAKYNTYNFGGWQEFKGQELNDLDKDRFLDAFKEEFAARNMTLITDSADVVFTLHFVMDVATITYVDDNLNKPQNLYHDKTYRETYNQLFQQEYEVGTVIVNFFDGETKEQIGQSALMKPISKNQKKHDENISKAVKTLMKKYPVDA